MAFANPYLYASGKDTGNPYFPDEAATQTDLPLWKRNELLEQLGKSTRSTASKLVGAIGVPGSLLYDAALGKPLFSGSTSADVLDSTGLRPSEDALGGWGRPLAELALDIGTDPLNLVSAGLGTASKAAKAAKAAGLMDDATRVAGRALVDDVATGARNINNLNDLGYARNTADAFQTHFGRGVETMTDHDLLSRPLVGARTARRNTTLQDLVQAQANPTQAIRNVDDWLRKNHNLSYADVAGDTLYNDIGLRLPKFLGGEITMNLPGGERVAAALDRVGQAARWSPLGRVAAAAVRKNVMGAVDEGDQILGKSLFRADQAAKAAANRFMAPIMRELAERSPAAFRDPAVSTAVRNVIEGTASAADQQLVTANNLDSFVTRWQRTSRDYIQRSRETGIGSAELRDQYGTGYFPRGVDRDVWGNRGASVTGGRDWSVMTGDQLARDAAYQVPGGTDAINRLSRDAGVLDAATDQQAADHIYNTLNAARGNGPEYSMQHAVKLARDIRSMTPEARAAGRGLFDTHFAEDMGRYVRGRERAMGRANVIYDQLAASAVPEHYLNVAGGGHNAINRTLADLDLRTIDNRNFIGPLPSGIPRGVSGARQQIVDRINARLAGTGQPMLTVDDLANVSVDQRLVQRFNRIADYYAMPEVQGVMGKFMDDLTRMWKSSILSFPARYARDWFSGAISNMVEVGSVSDLRQGYAASKYLLQGQMNRLESVVSQMPRYSGMAPQDAIAAFRDDIAATGLLTGRRLEDVGTNLTGRQTGQNALDSLVPGANPVTTLGYQAGDILKGRAPLSASNAAYSELYNRGIQGYTDSISRFGQALRNPSTFGDYIGDRNVTDPILRWGAKLSDTTDSINRLGGYNALLLQGISPEEAARRIMAAQVDYDSLTRFERGFIRSFVPFWAYNSRIGAYVAEKIFENPGGAYTKLALRTPDKLSQVSSANDPESYVPKQIKENVGFSLEPFRDMPIVGSIVNTIAPQTEGVNSYLNSIEVPGTGLINMLNVKQGLDGSIQPMNSAYNTVLDTTSQLMHPLIRDAVEMLSGRNLHTGKSLTEYEPTIQKLGRNLGIPPNTDIDTALKFSNYALDFVPHAPRALQLINRLIDVERVPDPAARLTQNAINALTGVKVSNISEDAARFDASRELMDMMSDSPVMRNYSNTFIPEELLPYASPEDLMIYRLDRQMRKEARNARKESAKDSTNPYGM